MRKISWIYPVMLWAVVAQVAVTPATAANHDVLTPEEKRAVEKVVRDYILANPKIVLDALKTLDAR